jgi:uncharacterized protein
MAAHCNHHNAPVETTTLILIIGAAVAGFVQGLSGFAFGLVATSIWAWWLPPQLVAVMSVFGALVGQLIAVFSNRRSLELPLLWPMVAGGLAGLPIGLLLLPHLDSAGFQFGVGLLLALWCPLMLFSGRIPHITFGGRPLDALIGTAGGFTGAVGGFTGPIPTLWSTLRGWPKQQQRVVIQNFNLVMLAVTFASYMATGVVTPPMWAHFVWVVPVLLVPVLLGARLFARISAEAFKRVVLALLAASGLALLLRSVPVIMHRLAV